MKLNVGIVGGSGFVGLELLRLLLAHPNVSVEAVTSREKEGEGVSTVHPSLCNLTSLKFSKFSKELSKLDLVFFAVAHGASAPLVRELYESSTFKAGNLKLIDLSTDLRFGSQRFDLSQKDQELLKTAVYGVPEIFKEEIRGASLIANPGCFANCITLGLAPLAQAGVLKGAVHVAAVTGSSGSGIDATAKTHHPVRNDSMAAYSILTHRHVPEVEQALFCASDKRSEVVLQLVPLSGPFTRGIFATSFVNLQDSTVDLNALYAQFAKQNKFVRIRHETPRLVEIKGSNFVDITVQQQGDQVVVISAIDNLVKGAAGNAIQCMNLMYKLDEDAGLRLAPLTP